MTNVLTSPVAKGLRWVAGVLGATAVLTVVVGIINFTATGPDLMLAGTIACVAFGFPAVVAGSILRATAQDMQHRQSLEQVPCTLSVA